MLPVILRDLTAELTKDIAAMAAAVVTPAISVISGGLACVLGAALLARVSPALRRARLRPGEPWAPIAEGRGEPAVCASRITWQAGPHGVTGIQIKGEERS